MGRLRAAVRRLLRAFPGVRAAETVNVNIGHRPVDEAYQLLVSREDRRYHAVWDREIFVLAAPGQDMLPAAVCGRGGCEPYDEARMPQPQACPHCFPWLRANAPEAVCIGAPRRNFAEHSDTSEHPPPGADRAGMASAGGAGQPRRERTA